MLGLSLHQPWGWSFAYAGKTLESRTWAPPESAMGQLVALHSAKTFDQETADVLRKRLGSRYRDIMPTTREDYVYGAVESVGRLIGAHNPTTRDTIAWSDDVHYWRGQCYLMTTDKGFWIRSPWRSAWAWCFAGVLPLAEPIPMRGQPGLWDVSEEDTPTVLAAYEDALALARNPQVF